MREPLSEDAVVAATAWRDGVAVVSGGQSGLWRRGEPGNRTVPAIQIHAIGEAVTRCIGDG